VDVTQEGRRRATRREGADRYIGTGGTAVGYVGTARMMHGHDTRGREACKERGGGT